MNSEKILMQINSNPVIAAVRSADELSNALATSVKVVFLLNSSLLQLGSDIEKCKQADKIVLVHFDLVSGLGNDEDAVKYLFSLSPHGVISTRSNVLKIASDLGLFTVQRFFIVDSRSCDTMRKSLSSFKPDMVEIMPGLLFKEIEEITADGVVNVICGGLIEDKATVIKLLSIGAMGISTSRSALWEI